MQKRILSAVVISLFICTIGLTQAFAVTDVPAMTPAKNEPAMTGANCDPTKTNCPSGIQTSGDGFNIKFKNPLKVSTIQEAVRFFINTLLKIAIPFIVVFFIWSGLNFILAQGNKDKVQKAKNMFLNTIIGSLLILGAWAITNAIVGTVNSIANTDTTISK
jgi:hypothetical protein